MSTKAPRVKWRKAIATLESMGWECARRGRGSHAIYKHPDHPRPITVLSGKPGADVSATVHKGLRRQMGDEAYKEFLRRAAD